VIQYALWSLTIFMDLGKAIWNRYLQLFLLHAGFSVIDVGVIKSSSLIAKMGLQLLIPALQDSGFFARYLSAHSLVSIAAMLTIPVIMSFERYCQLHHIQTIILMKSMLSFLSIFVGLSDGLVIRTVQFCGLKYSNMQSIHIISWCAAVLIGGFLVDHYGFSIIFPLVACSKLVVSCCVLRLAHLCPLEREYECNAWVSMKQGAQEIYGNTFLVKIMVLMVVWGSCFVVVETITFLQMDLDFRLSKYASGLSSVLSVVGALPVYHYAPALIRVLGHTNLIRLGIIAACVFLVLHSMLSHHHAMLALPLCVVRGLAYSAIWGACMDLVILTVPAQLLTSVTAMINFAWFTVGQGIGYVFWTVVYSKSGACVLYLLCAAVLMLTQFAFMDLFKHMPRFMYMFFFLVILLSCGSITFQAHFLPRNLNAVSSLLGVDSSNRMSTRPVLSSLQLVNNTTHSTPNTNKSHPTLAKMDPK